jgi:hypothetical protein
VAKARVRGCLYLEVGANVDEGFKPPPPPAGPGVATVDLCDVIGRGIDGRRLVDSEGSATGIEAWSPALVSDASGERLAYHSRPSLPWRIFYVVDGQLFEGATLGSTTRIFRPLPRHEAPNLPDLGLDDAQDVGVAPPSSAPPPPAEPPPDWSKVPPFEDAVSDVFAREPGHVDTLLSAIQKRSGEEGLLTFSKQLDPNVTAWTGVTGRLSAHGRSRQTAELVGRLRADAGVDKSGLFDFFLQHEELQPRDFPALLAADVTHQLEDEVPPAYGDAPASMEITALAKLGHPRAGEFACQSLGASWLGQLQEGGVMYESSNLDVSLLAVVVKAKTRCPWVTMALDRMVCSSQLWCTADGKTIADLDAEAQAEDAAGEVASTPKVVKVNRLCPPATGRRQAEASFADDAPSPEEGPLLLAAAVANGPLPKDFVARNARREYAVRGLPPEENPDGGDPDEPPCGLTEERVTALACSMPLDLGELRAGPCHVVVDDAKKTVSVQGPPAPRMGNDGEGPYHRD